MNDLLKSINLRLNNPFIVSFIISWIFWNWPIVVGLLWYNATTLPQYGYPNYKALIMDYADVWKNYILPLCFAVAYPYLKLGFTALQTTVNAIDERTTKRLSGKGYIPTQKFLDLRDQYETNIQKLSDVISKETEVINENLNLRTKLSEIEVEKNLLVEQTSSNKYENDKSLIQISSRKIFIGKWDISIKDNEGLDIDLEISFENSIEENGFLVGKGEEGNSVVISSYVFNPYSKQVALHIHIQTEETKFVGEVYGKNLFFFGSLKWNDNHTILMGTDHITFNEKTFEMRKIS